MNGDAYSRDSGRHGSSRSHFGSRGDRDRDDRRDRDRRRRSRSPQHRGSRRDYEVDTYSSSRDYREREREDTYARRERREDRGWERDSRPRRDPRRDDDDRHSRRDRDFDDRGGRGRRDRDRDGGFGGGRERKRSASPVVKKKEPTPDLTNVGTILNRQRRLTQWDIKPAGYDNITAEQAKLSGMFPLPGAPRQQPMDPSRLQAFMNQPAGTATDSSLVPSNARQARRLFVHNIPPSATNDSITEFFNLQMNGVNVVTTHDPCISSHISSDRSYAMLEFKSAEDATYGYALNGITMEEDPDYMGNGDGDRPGLSIRRPQDYISPPEVDTSDYVEDGWTPLPLVKEGPNKLAVTNIPVYLPEENVTELLAAFGPLYAFVLAKDTGSEQSRGIAFCQFMTDQSTDVALGGLQDLQLGEGQLKVQRASSGITQVAGVESGVNAMTLLAGADNGDAQSRGRVLQLMNMTTPDELMDPYLYDEILDDIKDECQKFGQILQIKMPRPSGPNVGPGVGKIFIKYSNADDAQKALRALAGRKFADRTVVVTFFTEEAFDLGVW